MTPSTHYFEERTDCLIFVKCCPFYLLKIKRGKLIWGFISIILYWNIFIEVERIVFIKIEGNTYFQFTFDHPGCLIKRLWVFIVLLSVSEGYFLERLSFQLGCLKHVRSSFFILNLARMANFSFLGKLEVMFPGRPGEWVAWWGGGLRVIIRLSQFNLTWLEQELSFTT